MKKIDIVWKPLDISVTATLLESKNPELCKILWKNLPMHGIQDHALISGEYMYGYIPLPELCSLCHFKAITKEPRSQQQIGRINVSVLQHFSIKYGVVSEYLKASPIAQIDECDLNTLSLVGKSVWESTFKNKELNTFYIRRSPHGAMKNDVRKDFKFISSEIAELSAMINAESQRIWLKAPPEIEKLITGRTKIQIGSFGYYFNSIVFVDGIIRSLGFMTLADILRMIDNEKISLSNLREIIKNAISPVVFEFLQYCGFDKLFSFYREFYCIVPKIKRREDMRGLLLSFINYVNRLSGWILHYFPWYLGKNMRRGEGIDEKY